MLNTVHWCLLGTLLASLPMGSVHINAVPLDYSGEEKGHDLLDSSVAQTSSPHDTPRINLKDQGLYFSVRQKDWQKVENMDWQKVENLDWPGEEYIDRLEVDKMDLSSPAGGSLGLANTTTRNHNRIGSTMVANKLFVPWDTKKQPSTSNLVTRTSILYVVCFIMAVSVLYVIGYGLYTAFTRCKSWFTSFFRANHDELPPVQLEESAGVSWTDGSNISSPQPGVQEPGELQESWAETSIDTNILGNPEASGTAAMISATGTVRRHIRSTIRGDEVPHEIG
ncbi:uncharacterized protein H6S33_004980 [Morchella sextelata]|uniref:uncharacterized protein n=1 Tax=Morchella sextelata TaxID=1174677 RepID=UPI001D04E185|nr:uncharacterized protein H6S33_004980 [Morchella sextelata]KAH0604998.1 hypothetical protein H6S33_004980 [Morchella sextelata]